MMMSSVEDVVGSCTPRLKLCNEDGTLKRGSRQERWAGLAEEGFDILQRSSQKIS
jgi:hypothetical protein